MQSVSEKKITDPQLPSYSHMSEYIQELQNPRVNLDTHMKGGRHEEKEIEENMD